jgi:hypothetical protein
VQAHQLQVECAAVAAWTSAALRGDVSLDEALDALHCLQTAVRFRLAHSSTEGQSLAIAVGSWRTRGVLGWRYVPVAPGDSGGMPGPQAVIGRASDVGAAMVSHSGPNLAMVPLMLEEDAPPRRAVASMVLDEVEVDGRGVTPHESLTDLDRALLTALTDATDRLHSLDVAGWSEQAADLMRGWDQAPPLPPGTPDRAQRLAARAGRILALVEVAAADPGGSRTASEMRARVDQLQGVARTARAAHAAAWNSATLASAPGR